MQEFDIIENYTAGTIGKITELHSKYYYNNWSFGHFFEAKVATELSTFINSFDISKDYICLMLKGLKGTEGTKEGTKGDRLLLRNIGI